MFYYVSALAPTYYPMTVFRMYKYRQRFEGSSCFFFASVVHQQMITMAVCPVLYLFDV